MSSTMSSAPNLLWAEWISFSFSVSLLGLLCLRGQHLAPESLQRVFKYGKTQETLSKKSSQRYLKEVPKRWFFHFYVFATLFYSLLLAAILRVYRDHAPPPAPVSALLDLFVGPQRKASVPGASVAMATVLMHFQVLRRLYECTRLSIYSSRGRMSLLHYLCGFFFYFGVGLSLLAEAHGFASATDGATFFPAIRAQDWLAPHHVLACALFVFFSYVQFRSHVILASLRKDAEGRVVTYRHSIPRGFFFEWVSCPHYFAEIAIYLSLSLLMAGQSTTWWMVCSFVTVNQVFVAIFNHNWYKDKFADYPQRRKAIFPFLL